MQTLLKYNEKDLTWIDIETSRLVDKLQPNTPLYDTWSYKMRYDSEQAAKTGDNTFSIEQSFKDKAALYAPFARIACIVVGSIQDGDKLRVRSFAEPDEKVLLTKFNEGVKLTKTAKPDSLFAGFNIIGFDLPFLVKRMLVNDIEPAPVLDVAETKPWDQRVLDLSTFWRGNSFYPDSLASVLVAMGLPSSKSVMNGSEVSDAYYAGKINDIVEYCKMDVLQTASLYRKFMHKKILSFE